MSSQVLNPQSIPSTSAGGAIAAISARRTILGVNPAIQGTATCDLGLDDWLRVSNDPLLSGTYAAVTATHAFDPEDASAALAEVRRISGLTWEQLAQVFGVSRRTLHFWASGKSLSSPNEEHLRRLLTALRRADRGAADINRAMLLTEREGTVPLQLLAERRYDEFLRLVGEGAGRARITLKPLSRDAWEARKPQPPEELVDALQDRAHKDVGRGRAARTVRIARNERREPER